MVIANGGRNDLSTRSLRPQGQQRERGHPAGDLQITALRGHMLRITPSTSYDFACGVNANSGLHRGGGRNMSCMGNRLSIGALMVVLLGLPGLAVEAHEQPASIELDIQATTVADALKTVAESFDLQIAFLPEDVEGFRSPRLAGRFTAEAAFARLVMRW
jgi:hypothetical protein